MPSEIILDFVPQSITTGPHHALMISKNGELYGIGDNSSGQLGIEANMSASPTWVELPLLDSGY